MKKKNALSPPSQSQPPVSLPPPPPPPPPQPPPHSLPLPPPPLAPPLHMKFKSGFQCTVVSVRSTASNVGSGRYQKNRSGSGGVPAAAVSPNMHKYQPEDTTSHDGTLKSSYSSTNSFSTLEASQLPSKSPFVPAHAIGSGHISNRVGPSSKPSSGISSHAIPGPPPPPSNTPYPEIQSEGLFSHRVAWPTGSMPRKVKKLSWEDELSNKTELDPEVSLTPMEQESATDIPNLTVYF
ncbi:unnamed protein product [Meganyctiphanes norvegica]|uniref:Uncharacterized protein n=1 Tax=Meganyctiphanes norvegica TaxID=48144 RepID=A0AAV2Q543_MEGNR